MVQSQFKVTVQCHTTVQMLVPNSTGQALFPHDPALLPLILCGTAMVYTPRPLPVAPVTAPASNLGRPRSDFRPPFKDTPIGVSWEPGLPSTLGRAAFAKKIITELRPGQQYVSELYGKPRLIYFLTKPDYSMRVGRGKNRSLTDRQAQLDLCYVYDAKVHTLEYPAGVFRQAQYNYPIVKSMTGVPGFAVERHHISIGDFWGSPSKIDFSECTFCMFCVCVCGRNAAGSFKLPVALLLRCAILPLKDGLRWERGFGCLS